MKKILLSVLVLSAAGAYSQEIRMPDEKRKEYIREEQKTTSSARPEQNETSDRNAEEERRKRALEARKKAAHAAQSQSDNEAAVYCIIEETRSLDGKEIIVSIQADLAMEKQLKGANRMGFKSLRMATEKETFKSGLEAINHFSTNGWTLSHSSSMISPGSENIIHRYIMSLPLH